MAEQTRIRSPFMPEGRWYRGNLHTHSTLSDGHYGMAELVDAYAGRGYHFLGLTEHNQFVTGEGMGRDGFLLLPGVEYNMRQAEADYRDVHLNIFPGTDAMLAAARRPLYQDRQVLTPRPFSGRRYDLIQEVIDEAAEMGCVVMLNHPHWSIIELEDILPLRGLFAMEVYNHSGQHMENMGCSDVTWESVLRAGRRLWGTATDDNHNRTPFDSVENDSFGGWVAVKARALTRTDVMEALIAGSFYASCGPEIRRFDLIGDEVFFECSPVQRISLVGDGRQYQSAVCETGTNGLLSFHKRLQGTERFIRVECADAWGRYAWTNPIFLR
jgi:hypothetical protein